uniref:RNA-directed DNA polymerase n=1 Tax=Strongyloides papillosus TaxID=174720 RepID=A0A0N5C2B1_STREA
MGKNKANNSNSKLSTSDKIINKLNSIVEDLPWSLIKTFGSVLIIVLVLSVYTNVFHSSFRVFQSLSTRDSIGLLKFSLIPNDTCFNDYNNLINSQKRNYSTVDYKKDIHVIILDGLKLNENFLPKENKKNSFIFSSFHTIGSDKNKRIKNLLNGKINNGCIKEDDESLLTKIFEKKGYQVKTFIDSTFANNILCSNDGNHIDKIIKKPNENLEETSKSKPSFSLSILSQSLELLKLKKLDEVIENIVAYQKSSLNNSYIILVRNNEAMYHKPYLMLSLPVDKQKEEYNDILSYNQDKPLTSNDLYATLTSSKENNTLANILTTDLRRRSCREMKVPIENCRCQSHFFKVPAEMSKIRRILKKRFINDLGNYFNNQKDNANCKNILDGKQDDIEIYYAFITHKEGIHFKVVLKMNEKRIVEALYDDNFFMISQGIVNIGENTKFYQIARTLASTLHIPVTDDTLQRLAEDNYLLANASDKHRRKTLIAELKRLYPSTATTSISHTTTTPPTAKLRPRSASDSVREVQSNNSQLSTSNIPTPTIYVSETSLNIQNMSDNTINTQPIIHNTTVMNTQSWTTIKEYNPAEDNIKSYLQRLNLFFDMDNITEDRRKSIATLTKMPASLLNELEQLPQTESQELKNNFANLRDYLHKVYGADKAQKNAQLRLRTFRIREQPKFIAEDLRQYEQLLRTTHTGSPDELLNRFKSHLLDKIRNDNLFNKLLNTTYESITELILDLEATMLVYQNRNQQLNKPQKTFQDKNDSTSTRNNTKPICTWCQKPNHNEDVCRYKASGKPKVECRYTPNTTQSIKTEEIETLTIDAKSSNPDFIGKAYKIQVKLNNQPRTTIISQDTADKYHIKYDSNKENVTLKVLNDNVIENVGIAEVSLAIGASKIQGSIVVAKGTMLKDELLLGTNIIDRFNQISFNQNSITIDGTDVYLTETLNTVDHDKKLQDKKGELLNECKHTSSPSKPDTGECQIPISNKKLNDKPLGKPTLKFFGWKISSQKSSQSHLRVPLGKPTLKFFGWKISSQSRIPDPSKVKSILNRKVPDSIKNVKSFLEATRYFHQSIEGYAQLALPITNLTKLKSIFQWTPDCQHSYDATIHKPSTPPVLMLPQFDRALHIYYGSSMEAMNELTAQYDNNKSPHPIRFYFKTWPYFKRQKSINLSELQAACYTLLDKSDILSLSNIIGYTDNESIISIFNNSTGPHAQSILNKPPDIDTNKSIILNNILCKKIERKNIELPKDVPLPIFLKETKHEYLTSIHDFLGHFGIQKTILFSKNSFYHEGMDDDIIKFINSCEISKLQKDLKDQHHAFERTLKIYDTNTVDTTTRFWIPYLTKDQFYDTIIAGLISNVITIFGAMKYFLMDNQSSLKTPQYQQLSNKMSTQCINTKLHHKTGNSLVKRSFYMISNSLLEDMDLLKLQKKVSSDVPITKQSK